MQQGQILFPLLKRLNLFLCPNLNVGLPGCYLPSLEDLRIENCKGMVSFTTPPSLVEIRIDECPVLGSHSNVKRITLSCSKRLQNDLHTFSSLESLYIEGWQGDSFPNDEGLLPTNLKTLDMSDCSKLETLNGKAFQQLTSLQTLIIFKCERLWCLPKEGLPNSLTKLSISGCPLVQKRCENGGEDWPKIQHITDVNFDLIHGLVIVAAKKFLMAGNKSV
ncbi:hypothetical protein CsatB_018807 [Cannabis sativa]